MILLRSEVEPVAFYEGPLLDTKYKRSWFPEGDISGEDMKYYRWVDCEGFDVLKIFAVASLAAPSDSSFQVTILLDGSNTPADPGSPPHDLLGGRHIHSVPCGVSGTHEEIIETVDLGGAKSVGLNLLANADLTKVRLRAYLQKGGTS